MWCVVCCVLLRHTRQLANHRKAALAGPLMLDKQPRKALGFSCTLMHASKHHSQLYTPPNNA
jgi:hypothetical protein